jgi:hypothetical protein
MTTYSVRSMHSFNYDENYEKFADNSLHRQLSATLNELIFALGRTEHIVISPIRQDVELGMGIYVSPSKILSVNVEYSRTRLVERFGGYTYYSKEIIHPDKLSFWNRVKFIFTGRYPE